MNPQARRAYEAWCNSLGSDPDWDSLLDGTKEAWWAAVVAAVDSPPKTESLTEKQVRILEETETIKLAKIVKAAISPDRGFILLTAQDGAGGSLAYVATMDRDDAIRTVREWLKHQGAL
jgi:hypothetical protein